MNRFAFVVPSLFILVATSAFAQNPSTNIDVKADVKGACQIVSAAESNRYHRQVRLGHADHVVH